MKDLSVIIPIYNAEAHLEALVATLVEQRVLGPEATIDAEVLLVDDGSTDASARMIARIVSEYPAVVALRGNHGGPAGARPAGPGGWPPRPMSPRLSFPLRSRSTNCRAWSTTMART